MQISLKKMNNSQMHTFFQNKCATLSVRERRALVGLLAVASVALGMYLSTGNTDPEAAMPNKIVAPTVKKQPVVTSNQVTEGKNSNDEAFGEAAYQANPFLPPPQYQARPGSVQQQIESKAPASTNVNAVPSYKIVTNRPPLPFPEQRPSVGAAVRPVLQGIAQGAGQAKAVISYEKHSAAYGINDFVGSYQVTEITDDSVILSGAAGSLVLTLKK